MTDEKSCADLLVVSVFLGGVTVLLFEVIYLILTVGKSCADHLAAAIFRNGAWPARYPSPDVDLTRCS